MVCRLYELHYKWGHHSYHRIVGDGSFMMLNFIYGMSHFHLNSMQISWLDVGYLRKKWKQFYMTTICRHTVGIIMVIRHSRNCCSQVLLSYIVHGNTCFGEMLWYVSNNECNFEEAWNSSKAHTWGWDLWCVENRHHGIGPLFNWSHVYFGSDWLCVQVGWDLVSFVKKNIFTWFGNLRALISNGLLTFVENWW